MLDYKNYIQQIFEGLIITHDLDKSIKIISKLLDEFSIFYKIEKNNEYKAFKIFIEDPCNLTIFHYEKLFTTLNNLGYFESAFRLTKNSMSKIYKWNNFDHFIRAINNMNLLEIIIESKKDKELNKLPLTLYHLTNNKKVQKILKIGIIPKNNNKKSFHLERIYLTDKLEKINILLEQFLFNDKLNNKKEDYTILTIDTSDLNIKLYLDPNFKNGYYTEENIKPESIKIFKSI